MLNGSPLVEEGEWIETGVDVFEKVEGQLSKPKKDDRKKCVECESNTRGDGFVVGDEWDVVQCGGRGMDIWKPKEKG